MTPVRKEEIEEIKLAHKQMGNLKDQYVLASEYHKDVAVLLASLEEAQQQTDKNKRLWSNAQEEMDLLHTKLTEAHQTIDRLTVALIKERDDALTWDGIGTVNRINKELDSLREGTKAGDKTEPDEGVPTTEEQAYYTNE